MSIICAQTAVRLNLWLCACRFCNIHIQIPKFQICGSHLKFIKELVWNNWSNWCIFRRFMCYTTRTELDFKSCKTLIKNNGANSMNLTGYFGNLNLK